MANAIDYSNPLYYRHSGQFSGPGLIVATLGSIVVAIVLGAAYAYVDLYNPCISIVTFIATGGFGFAVGWTTTALLRRGRVRNSSITAGIAVVSAMVALYSSWVFWIYALMQKSIPGALPFTPLNLALNPLRLWRLVQFVNETGAWSIGGHAGSSSSSTQPVTGAFLWAVWIIEACLVTGISMFTTITTGGTLPFCEKCDRWCPPGKRLFSTPPTDPAVLKDRLEAKDFAHLIALGPGKLLGSNWLEVYAHSCPNCSELYTLTVNSVSMKADKKGKQQRSERPMVNKLLLSAKEYQALITLKAQYDAQFAVPAAKNSAPETATEEANETEEEDSDDQENQ